MPRDNELYLEDILDSIEKIQQYTINMNYDDFSQNPLVIDATILNVIKIGEAANMLPEDTIKKMSEIPWQSLIAMRNILVHQYHRVDLEILWNLVQVELEKIYNTVKSQLQGN